MQWNSSIWQLRLPHLTLPLCLFLLQFCVIRILLWSIWSISRTRMRVIGFRAWRIVVFGTDSMMGWVSIWGVLPSRRMCPTPIVDWGCLYAGVLGRVLAGTWMCPLRMWYLWMVRTFCVWRMHLFMGSLCMWHSGCIWCHSDPYLEGDPWSLQRNLTVWLQGRIQCTHVLHSTSYSGSCSGMMTIHPSVWGDSPWQPYHRGNMIVDSSYCPYLYWMWHPPILHSGCPHSTHWLGHSIDGHIPPL